MFDWGFKITRILNNNAVMILDDTGREVIAFGKGIGFKNHVGGRVKRAEVLKTYVSLGGTFQRKLLALLEEIPFECVEITERIIEYAGHELKAQLNPGILINLADHINFTITRYREGITAPLAISEEIKQFYPDEYRVGQHAVAMLNQFYHVELDSDEATSIAFHIINATCSNDSVRTRHLIEGINALSQIICKRLGIKPDGNSLVYSRLIIHLKFLLRQIVGSQNEPSSSLSPDEAGPLLETLLTAHSDIQACLDEASSYIADRYGYRLTSEDELYLALHLARLSGREHSA